MRSKSFLALLFALLFLGSVFVACQDAAEDVTAAQSDVLDLSDLTFDDTIKKHDMVLVEFFAPWCGHCQRLAPEYEKAATILKGKTDKAVLAKVDCTKENALAQRFEIQGFPTLKLLKNGGSVVVEYQGPRTAEAIVAFVERHQGPAVKLFESEADVTDFTKNTKDLIPILGFFDDKESAAYKVFSEVADKLRETFSFGAVLKSEITQKLGAAIPSVHLYKPLEDAIKYSFETVENAAEHLTSWLRTNKMPLIDEISGHNFRDYRDAGIPMAVLFVDYSDKDAVEKIREGLWRDMARQYKGKISFVYVDSQRTARQAEFYGVQKFPGITIDAMKHTPTRYPFPADKEVNAENVKQFFDDYLAGRLEPFSRSEPVPETETQDGLTTVVGKSFNRIVVDPSKDVLVEFYSPNCGHCKALEPTYKKLAETFKDIDSVVIAQFNGVANDPPANMNIRGFPTVMFFPATRKAEPIEYKGDRSLADLIKFVKDNADTKFELNVPVAETPAAETTTTHDEL